MTNIRFIDSFVVVGYNYKEQFNAEDHKWFPEKPMDGQFMVQTLVYSPLLVLKNQATGIVKANGLKRQFSLLSQALIRFLSKSYPNAYHGQLLIYGRTSVTPGDIQVTVKGLGLKTGTLDLNHNSYNNKELKVLPNILST